MADSGLSTVSSRTWALIGTLLFHGLVLGLLFLLVLDYNKRRDEMMESLTVVQQIEEEEEDETVLKPGEFVEVGDDFFEQASAPEETAPASNIAQPASGSDHIIASTRPSPIKVPVRRDSVKIEARRRAAEKQAEEARAVQAKKIGARVQFGTAAVGEPSDRKPGSVDGNTTDGTGSLSGKPGANVKGRTLANWSSPSATSSGTIVIAVRVDRKGRVTSASYQSGTGAVASSNAARQSCIRAAKASSFSVADDAPAEQTGLITYRFLPPR